MPDPVTVIGASGALGFGSEPSPKTHAGIPVTGLPDDLWPEPS